MILTGDEGLSGSGIYEIVNLENGKRYVGSSVNLKSRRREHFSSLCRGNHRNPHLQHAWDKYGEESFEFRVVLHCASEDLLREEQDRIDSYDFDELYNAVPTAGSVLGFRHSEESKAKMSLSKRSISLETREKMSTVARNRTYGAETRKKLSDSAKSRVVTLETRTKISIANSNPSPETRARKSMSHLGNTNRRGSVASDETRKRMSLAQSARQQREREERLINNAKNGE